MTDVVIYTTSYCPFCIRAKALLESKQLKYREIPVDNDPQQRQEMAQKAGSRTVPQIWINQQHIGGCSDLMALDRSGELARIIAAGS